MRPLLSRDNIPGIKIIVNHYLITSMYDISWAHSLPFCIFLKYDNHKWDSIGYGLLHQTKFYGLCICNKSISLWSFFFLNRKLEVMCIRTSQWEHIRLFSTKVVIQKGILIQLFYQDAYCFTVTHEYSIDNRTSTMYTKLIDCCSVTDSL